MINCILCESEQGVDRKAFANYKFAGAEWPLCNMHLPKVYTETQEDRDKKRETEAMLRAAYAAGKRPTPIPKELPFWLIMQRCRKCGGWTSRQYARSSGGLCKRCG